MNRERIQVSGLRTTGFKKALVIQCTTMTLEDVFKTLDEFERVGKHTIDINEYGVYKYLFNSPTMTDNVDPNPKSMYNIESDESDDYLLYVIPRNGDILLYVDVEGVFAEATLYQYDWTGSRKIVYEQILEAGRMNPFPESGIPLLQCGKALYIEVKATSHVAVAVTATYAFLETESRCKLAQYVFPNTEHGIKAVHANGDIYQAINIHDLSYSPNYFALVRKSTI